MSDVYQRLARHLGGLLQGYPFSEDLPGLLAAGFTPREAEAVLAIPDTLDPLQVASLEEVAERSSLPKDELAAALDGLARRGSVYSAPAADGGPGYALLQVGYGMPQTYFWAGPDSPRAREMAKAVIRYFKVPVTRAVYGDRPTKTFRYAPASLTVELPRQGVLPLQPLARAVEGAGLIALAHCPCRVSALVLGQKSCPHSLEVCLKYDEMAQFVIDKGLARRISADQAMAVLKAAEEEGLVHMVDNVAGGIKHTCNCCGCWCWNVGIIKRRKVPRDALMACYYIREDQPGECLMCGACQEVCPVGAVSMGEEGAVVDREWCIGCGVCAVRCPAGCISMAERADAPAAPADTGELFARLREGI